MTGQLRRMPNSGSPARLGIGRHDLHCGDPLHICVQGIWLRGRVEYDSRLGWYWTDNAVSVPLRPGMQARIP